MATDYSIILKALLNTSTIGSQLLDIQKQIDGSRALKPIKINIFPRIDDAFPKEVSDIFDKIKSQSKLFGNIDIFKKNGEDIKFMVKSIDQFNQSLTTTLTKQKQLDPVTKKDVSVWRVSEKVSQNSEQLMKSEQNYIGANFAYQAKEQQKLAEENIVNTRKVELAKQASIEKLATEERAALYKIEQEKKTFLDKMSNEERAALYKTDQEKKAIIQKAHDKRVSQIEELAVKEATANAKSLENSQKQSDAMAQRALETQARFQGKTGSPQIKTVLDTQDQILAQKKLADAMIAVGNVPGATKYTKSMADLTDKSKIAEKSLGGVKGALESLRDGFTRAIKNVFEYGIAYNMLNGAVQQFQQSIQYVKDLNKEMTNIQLVTGGTDEQTKNLAVGYNTLAKEMGATTLEIARGSLEFVRQGKSAEETGILIKNSMMMSKLGNMDSSQSTDRLTSIMNGFKLKAEETIGVVDVLINLDNQFATSIDEISTAMKYGSNTAQQVGVDFNHLASYITVISSTTRQSAEMIGQAFPV